MMQMDADPDAVLPASRNRPAGFLMRVVVVIGLGIGFVLVPALQGINLEADQSIGVDGAARAADAAAAREVAHLISQR